ncbi:hypothetical protein PUNSTDRAFT_139389 [Punctularia strigosozonata HHB-11173 SS5]|uniref:MARVEL domain-containing protein n=1 Tax=Punctularia strigosozonata (strain HHB-11173) TaxID=741275 RepID=R7RZY0_PUNST|nr:uncharacterized protein PUNSTDRAFT_139389 [Punctularia strigosozonata HHB-11173 SS5]EIN03675.1 hypothetical protein PUNSTDRAFT_139389 [Punctularia strigosozonata HHB-11173 SS5]
MGHFRTYKEDVFEQGFLHQPPLVDFTMVSAVAGLSHGWYRLGFACGLLMSHVALIALTVRPIVKAADLLVAETVAVAFWATALCVLMIAASLKCIRRGTMDHWLIEAASSAALFLFDLVAAIVFTTLTRRSHTEGIWRVCIDYRPVDPGCTTALWVLAVSWFAVVLSIASCCLTAIQDQSGLPGWIYRRRQRKEVEPALPLARDYPRRGAVPPAGTAPSVGLPRIIHLRDEVTSGNSFALGPLPQGTSDLGSAPPPYRPERRQDEEYQGVIRWLLS